MTPDRLTGRVSFFRPRFLRRLKVLFFDLQPAFVGQWRARSFEILRRLIEMLEP